jgi:hypothetical protein
MPSTTNVILCAATALLIWTCVGAAVARWAMPARSLVWPTAPALGWAVHSAAALPVFILIGLSPASVTIVMVGSLAVSALMLWRSRDHLPPDRAAVAVPSWLWLGAAIVALAPTLAILPKAAQGGLILAAPIFDHAKVAMIDEMARLGVPPGNPFFGAAGEPAQLAYYYLGHFSAAELAVLLGISGWEADAAMTWFTAFASLMLMIALTNWLGRRRSGGALVLLLALTGSLRPLLGLIPGADSIVREATGFAGWLFQATWVPQHVASASCVVLAICLLSRLASRASVALLATLVLVAVAGFQSSAWVGGVTFAAAAVSSGVWLIVQAPARERIAFARRCALAALCAIALAAPFLYDQHLATAARGNAFPVALAHYQVLGERFPEVLRRLLDLPAYGLVLLVVEFPAVYVTGGAALVHILKAGDLDAERRSVAIGLAGLVAASLTVSWLLASTLSDNNDLGWRAVLPGAMVLTVFAALGLVRWVASRAWLAAILGLFAIGLGLPDGIGIIHRNAVGAPSPLAREFAATPAMWAAVRRHAGPHERIGNNPLFMQEMTPWPVNISWALLSNRRSCYAGNDLALPYAPMPRQRLQAVDAQFTRVFAGDGDGEDVRALAGRYGCRVVVVTAQDGAWERDPFAASPYYRLVESSAQGWRIYVSRPESAAGR